MIELPNPRKEEKETLIKKKKRKNGAMLQLRKVGHVVKNCWYIKDKRDTKGKEEGANLARQDSDDYEDMVVMTRITNDHVDSKI